MSMIRVISTRAHFKSLTRLLVKWNVYLDQHII